MKRLLLTIAIYALFILTGGLMGYIKAGSLPSLLASSGAFLLFCVSFALLLRRGLIGAYIALGGVILLDAFFSYRYLTTHAFIPSGVSAVLSLLAMWMLSSGIQRFRAKSIN